MAGLNKVILIGRIGRDPDTFIYDDGTKKISFSLATTESYRDRGTNEWREQTEWHNIVGYRYLADKKIAKGDLVYIEGKIKSRKYKDKDGNEKYFTDILSEKINLLGHPKSASEYSNTADSYNTKENDTNTETPNPKTTDTPVDDLPF